uniref:Uncharacterized protein n=1 Tax=Clastoptera arizonana TaxID=38151 RepID=A0A1B6DK16_9HEMI
MEIKSSISSFVPDKSNSSNSAEDATTYYPFIPWPSKLNTAITGFYIFAGLSALIIFYFVIKALRLRRRRSKVRRYGILTSHEDVELSPLENGDDDDEDSTVFDISEYPQTL